MHIACWKRKMGRYLAMLASIASLKMSSSSILHASHFCMSTTSAASSCCCICKLCVCICLHNIIRRLMQQPRASVIQPMSRSLIMAARCMMLMATWSKCKNDNASGICVHVRFLALPFMFLCFPASSLCMLVIMRDTHCRSKRPMPHKISAPRQIPPQIVH